MNDSDFDDLSAKLRAWTVESRVPGSFQRNVWQRISMRQEVYSPMPAEEGAGYLRTMTARIVEPGAEP